MLHFVDSFLRCNTAHLWEDFSSFHHLLHLRLMCLTTSTAQAEIGEGLGGLISVSILSGLLSLLAPAMMGLLVTMGFESVGLLNQEQSESWPTRLAYGFGFLGAASLLSVFFLSNISQYANLWSVTQATGGVFLAYLLLCILMIYFPVCLLLNVILLLRSTHCRHTPL